VAHLESADSPLPVSRDERAVGQIDD